MNTIKHALKKFEKEKGNQKSNESIETAKYSRLSEMEKNQNRIYKYHGKNRRYDYIQVCL